MNKKCAIVLGSKSINATGLIRSLGRENFHVCFMSYYKTIESRYTDEYVYLPKEKNFWLTVIRDYIDKLGSIPFVYPSDDDAAFWLDDNYEQLENIAVVPNASGKLRRLSDKTEMAKIAVECGMNVPETAVYDVSELHSSIIRYPIILKPLSGVTGSKGDICICRDKNDTESACSMLGEKNYQKVLCQALIDAPGQYEVGITGFATKYGQVIIPGVVRKIRTYPIGRGTTSYARYEKKEKYAQTIDFDVLSEFVRKTGYVGIFDIDLIVSDEKSWFIEINYRNGQYGYITTVAGCNLPAYWAYSMEKCISEQNFDIQEIYYMNERDDRRHVRDGVVSYWQWKREFREASAYGMYCKGDQRPFIRQYVKIPDRVVIMMKKLINKARNYIIREEWNIAIRQIDGPMLYEDGGTKQAFQLIRNSWRYWCADPFIISVGTAEYLFFEMFDRIKGKGVIGYRVIDENGKIGKLQVAYESEHHLSFPFVFEYDGAYYMMPESSGDKNLTLLKAVHFPDQWEKLRVWFEGEEVCDSVVFQSEGQRYLLSQPVEHPYTHAKLNLYKYSDGRWVACDINPVVNDRSVARMAGAVINKSGTLIRPSQDCKTYGDAVNFNKILSLGDGYYKEELLRKVSAREIAMNNSNKSFDGVHTYNSDTRHEVIDVKNHPHVEFAYLLSIFNR